MKKILILVGDCVEDSQIDFSYKTLLTLGHKVDIACPKKKEGDFITSNIFEPGSFEYFVPGIGHKYNVTCDINTIDYKSYDALYLPGGHSPLHLHMDPKVVEIAKYFLDSKKTLVSICYSGFILAATKSISGRKLTGLPYSKIVIELAGAQYIDTLCTVDGNIISAIGNPGLIKMMEEFLKALK